MYLKDMDFKNGIESNNIPEIDLYMDQVIQLFESELSILKRNKEDKVLTKTMVNNYAKGKLLLPIKNKKYSKEHLILMSLIYNLKGALSINDIKISLNSLINTENEKQNEHIRELYSVFLEEEKNTIEEFKIIINNKEAKIKMLVEENENLKTEYDEKFLLLCSLVNMSNMYRRASEKLIDEYFSNTEGE